MRLIKYSIYKMHDNIGNLFEKIRIVVLINYYDVEKAILLVATHESRANFKVGFSNIGKNLNDFMINTNLGNYKVFIQELFRYIKILNKNRN